MNVLNNFCKQNVAKIRPTKTQEAKRQKLVDLLSACACAAVTKNKVPNYLMRLELKRKKQFNSLLSIKSLNVSHLRKITKPLIPR